MHLNFLTDNVTLLIRIEHSRLDLLETLKCLVVHIEVLEGLRSNVRVFAANCIGARVMMMLVAC